MMMNKKPPRLLLKESLRNKKVLSVCSNLPCCLYSGHGDRLNSAEKVDDCSAKRSSNSPTKNELATVSLRARSALKATVAEDHLAPLGMATDVTPNKVETDAKVNGDKTPGQVTPSAGFSALTVVDFGITPESATQQRMGDCKSLLKKLRRRSAIGARGSPENNSLIQYIAHQKITEMENPSQASPFQHRSVLLKDKIAAFQSSFKPLEEAEEGLIQKRKTSTAGGPGLLEWHLECKSLAVEEDLNDRSIHGERISADLPAVPALEPSAAESLCLPFEATPVTDAPKTACGIRSQRISEELSRSAASQQSSKKVRFAEKESLEVFDKSKLPVTPLQKGQFSSSVLYRDGTCLRSVLKKPQVLFEDSEEGSGASLVFGTCGLLQIESNTRQVSITEEDEKNQVLTTLPLLEAPLLRGVGPCSPSGPSQCSPNHSTLISIKQPLPQLNFDNEEDLLPESSEVVPSTECAANSDLEESKNRSPDSQATCARITRSSFKRKLVRAARTEVLRPTDTQSKRAPTCKIPKPNKVEKAKKTTASRRKVSGKRRKKKEEKAFHGQRETVSKKPFLSPIPELKEELSFASYQSTPKLQISILDDSNSSDACEKHTDKTERKDNGALQHPMGACSGLNISLDLVKEDALPAIQLASSQLQDAAVTAEENPFSSYSPEKPAPAKLKGPRHTNERVLRRACSSSEPEMRKELDFLAGDGTSRKNNGRRALDLAGDPALELMCEGQVNVNFKRLPRRSQRLSSYLPNSDDGRSETPENNVCVSGSLLAELLPTSQTVNDSGLLNDLQRSIEESFRCVSTNNPKRVRRSMRGFKDAENSGLAWIDVPAHDPASRASLGCASTAQRQKRPSSSEELGCLYQKQDQCFQALLPMKEDPESVVMGPCRSKAGRKRSFCALRPEENETVVLPSRRNRRASLGYLSDQCYRKDPEFRKLLLNWPAALI